MIKINKLLIVLILLAMSLLAGFLKFYSSIKNYKMPESVYVQGIAVLTGGKGRIAEGIKVFRKNRGSYLLISGVDKSVDIEEIIPIDFLRDKKVFIDKNSETTIDNANAIIDWSYKNNIKNIFIVTSDYHMPRSMLVLSKKGKALNFYANPVISNIDFGKNFLKDLKTLQFLLEEYFKYLFCLVT